MLKTLLKLTAKTLTLLCISAVFLFFSTLETRAAVGLSVGHNALNLLQTENLFYGNVGSGSHASSSFLLFQNNGADRLRVDISGNLTTSGAITASAFSGPLTGQLNAANVSSGQFGANVGNGNFSFPGNVGIGTTSPASQLNVVRAAGDNLIYADNYSTTGGNSNYWFSRRSHDNTAGARTTTLTGDYQGVFYFQGVNISNAFAYGSEIVSQQNGVAGTYVPTDLKLSTYSATAKNSNQLVLLNNGNVGIGTTNLAAKLDVYGDAKFGSSVTSVRYASFDTSGRLLVNYNDNSSSPINFLNLRNLDVSAGITHINRINFAFARTGDATERQSGGLMFGKEQEWTSTGNTNDSYFAIQTSLDSTVSEKFRVTSGGNVGIGTTTPSSKLYVNGTSIFNDVATFTQPVVVGAPVLNTHAATKNYVDSQISSSTGAIAFWGGSLLGNIGSLNTGNVGIGTTNPTSGKLQIGPGGSDTTLAFNLGAVNTHASIQSYNSNLSLNALGNNVGVGTSAPTSRLSVVGGTIDVAVNSSNLLRFSYDTTNGGQIQSFISGAYAKTIINPNGGNVGIGTTTPSAKLYVNGTSIFNDVATFTQPVIVGAPVLSAHAATKNYVDSQISSSTGAIALWGGAVGSNIWSLNSGNVGIGTSSPQAKLDILANNVALGASYNTPGNLVIHTSNNVGADIGGSISLGGRWAASLPDNISSFARLSGRKEGSVDGAAGGYLAFEISQSVNPYIAERMRITSTGNVGIGTITPNSRLHVYNSVANAEIDVQSLVGAGNHWGLYSNLSDNSFRLWGGSDFMTILRTSGNIGIGLTNPSSQLYVYNDSGTAPVATFDSHYTSSSTFGGIDIFRSGTKAPGEGISYLFSALDNGGVRQEYAGIAGQIEANTINAEQGRMIFFTTDNGVTRSEKVRITSNGRVGIGVTNPILALSVDGTSGLPASSGTSQVGSLRLGYAGGGNVLDFGVNVGGTTWLQATTKDDLSRYYSLVLNPNGGNVGIGTTNPTAEFYVNASSIFNDVATFTQPVIVGAPVLSGHAATKNYVDSQISSSTGAIALWGGTVGSNIWSLNSANVGIGTTTPNTKLHVLGSIKSGGIGVNGSLYLENAADGGGGATLSYAAASGLTIAQVRGLASNIIMGGSGIELQTEDSTSPYTKRTRMIIKHGDSGNVGIGTVSPNSRLHVYSASPNAEIDIQSLVGAGNHWGLYSNLSDNSFRLWGGSDFMTVLRTSGNIGIGTTNPGSKLAIAAIGASSTPLTMLQMFNNIPYVAGNGVGAARIELGHGILHGYIEAGSISETDSSSGYIAFGNRRPTNSITEAMRINNVGNVGIGTTNPAGKLDVSAGLASQTAGDLVVDTANTTVYIGKLDTASGNTNFIFRDRLGNIKSRWNNAGSGSIYFGNMGSNYGMKIQTAPITAGANAVTNGLLEVDGSGRADGIAATFLNANVGIGTTTPATRLTVVGSGNYSIDAGNYRIGNVATPVSSLDAVNKSYLDSAVGTAQNAFWNLSGSNLFASSSSWNVGIGTSSPSTKLDVIGGLRITGPLQLSNVLYMGGGNRVLMVDNAGNVSATSTAPSASTVPVFVGITPSSYNGTSGGNPGYAYANSVCAAAFSGSHVCTTYEMLNTINASSTMPTADAWVHSGPPGYTALANDCDGRRSISSAAYGAYWQMSDSSYSPHGRGLLMVCNNSLQYACCR